VPWITVALLMLAPFGALVSQETPQPATPTETQAPAKKPPTPTSKPAADAAKSAPVPAKTSPAGTEKSGGDKPGSETGKAPAAGGEQPEKSDDIDKSKAPTIFVPTQKTSADNSATFPIDI